ncbi:hypothetical protein KVR01_012414 [Diaporthe batatas]|uniref:uncharacterized protein n=1 Tax=Diaporthe batatas TaxID=748121 RepID=UPI001D036D6F|nr:uncharacterized protein KVR01_012414 [Diaporthe batatas]KAG8157752.1 hypothetical protein KVR01_012414 [Diaporthe batatas]
MLYTLLLTALFVAIATPSFAHAIPADNAAGGASTPGQAHGSIIATVYTTAQSKLEIKIANNASDTMYAYLTGIDPSNGKAVVFQNGADRGYYPTQSGVIDSVLNQLEIEIGTNTDKTVTLKQNLSSGRVYIGAKKMTFMADPSGNVLTPSPSDPNDPNYGFPWGLAELTWSNDGQLATDLSFVDSFSLALGLKVTTTDGNEIYNPGLPAGSLKKVCDQLSAVSDDWGNMCVKDQNGKPVRAIAPSKYINDTTADSIKTFYDPYVDDVWKRYSTDELTINTQQEEWGQNVTCKCGGSVMACAQPDGKTYNYNKPTTMEILGCNGGPFTSSGDGNDLQSRTWPRLCAAFTRSTLLLDGGDVTPSSEMGANKYYTTNRTNHYARIIHNVATPSSVGTYAFAFDDVNAPGTGENEAGLFQVGNAKSVEIEVRGT